MKHQMNTVTIPEDMQLHCVKASSFPHGVLAAHQQLHGYVAYDPDRNYFGISFPAPDGTITYRAAAEELHPGEFSRHHLETFLLKKGTYLYTDLPDFRKDVMAIGSTFQAMIAHPGIDPQGCCVEWYQGPDDCRCMVRLKD